MPRTTRAAKTKSFLQVANWKMNKTIREAKQFIEQFVNEKVVTKQQIWFAVPFTDISPMKQLVGDVYQIGAQNMHEASSGAYTGEIAAEMLLEAGASFVILGHSERRKYFHETDSSINKKVLRAIEAGLKPIVCIGESFEEREEERTEEVLKNQLLEGLKDVSVNSISSCIIAYEPIWAIGTGKTATSDMVVKAHEAIRSIFEGLYEKKIAEEMTILYGGSVSPASAEELSKSPGVNGFLIGTASLDPATFAKIVTLSENTTVE
jgi:triosephosphate isomerase (TIM)